MSPLTALLLLVPLALMGSTRTAGRSARGLGAGLDRIGSVPGRGEALVFVIVVILGSVPTLLNVVPPPSTPDEFSYLLAADTFARGRLTNPRHPLWEHFETLHVLVTPTYASKYPPALGMFMALGQILWRPIVGAWLSTAVAAAAVCWMLRGGGLFEARWAIVGGLLAGLHPQPFWWGQTYWGGSPAMLGSALLIGSVLRMLKDPRAVHGMIAASGIAILANSRAYEGLILTFITGIVVMISAARRRALVLLLARTAIPAICVLVAAGTWMAYYNWRVTHDPLQMPYTLYASQYQVAPLFYWQDPREPPPEYRHRRIAEYWTGYDLEEWRRQSTWPLFWRGVGEKFRTIVAAYFRPVTLAVALVALPWALARRRDVRMALAVLLVFFAIQFATTPWMRMHYLGPVVPLFVGIVAACLRELSQWKLEGWSAGAGLVRAVVLLQVATPFIIIVQMAQNIKPPGSARQELVERLRRETGEHLVIVEYAPGPQHLFEWVYNEADIDASKVIFAHDMGAERNRELLDYYRSRRVWRLAIGGNRFSLEEQLQD